jgi:hypothetical protein
MFKIGDIIDYCFYSKVEVIDIDDIHYTLKDKHDNEKRVYLELVNKYGKLKGKN